MKYVMFFLVALLVATVFYGRAIADDGDVYNDGFWRVTSTGAMLPVTDNNVDIGSSSYQIKNIYKMSKVTNMVTTATIAAADMYGGTITNRNALGAMVLTLPDAETGMEVTVTLVEDTDVTINPQDAEFIFGTNGVGEAMSSDALSGSSMTLRAISTTTWATISSKGTWTDVN